jgi:transmembrane sensor
VRALKSVGRHVQPPLDDARLERQWQGVVERRRSRPVRGPLVVAFAVAALAVATLVVVLVRQARPAPTAQGTVVETSSSNPQPLTLADGSQVEVARQSRVSVEAVTPESVRLALTRGSLTADVARRAERVFTVAAGGYEVVVHGTRFRVALVEASAPSRATVLTVLVERGKVEVRPAGSTKPGRFLEAGDGWTEAVASSKAAGTSAAAAAGHEDDDGEGSTETPLPTAPGPASSASGTVVAPHAAPLSSRDPVDEPGFAALVRERKYKEAFASLGDGGFGRAVASADAKKLLELADVARLAGHPKEAALALDRLRKNYRGDSRAGLAAFELGRLRMDTLGDRAGALSAFEDAVSLSRSGAVREDAEARRVMVLESLGNTARCQELRDAYLSQFPSGVHVATIRNRCLKK